MERQQRESNWEELIFSRGSIDNFAQFYLNVKVIEKTWIAISEIKKKKETYNIRSVKIKFPNILQIY